MSAEEVLRELEKLGQESTKRMLCRNHGVREPCFGVRIGDLQKIRRRIKKDYHLALELYATGNYDAMYLAGLIADDVRMTKQDLQVWVEGAYGGALPGTTVASVAAGSLHGREMAMEWIESTRPMVAAAGWATLGALVAITPDERLDLREIDGLLERVRRTIHASADAVRYQMNSLVIAVGSFVRPLTSRALEVGEQIGPVTADLGDNQCQVPFAPDYIRKVEEHGNLGKKRKTVKC